MSRSIEWPELCTHVAAGAAATAAAGVGVVFLFPTTLGRLNSKLLSNASVKCQ
jgi:hypothetical protein